jgi:glycosyltransferase involved in cell wall biosynthesis
MTTKSKKTIKPESGYGDNPIIGRTTNVSRSTDFISLATVIDRVNLLNKTKNVSIVIPILNEEKNLPYVLPIIPYTYEIIMVDGHSIDDSIKIAKQHRPNIRILTQPGRGKGDAMRYAFKQAKGDIIVTFDADGSVNFEETYNMINLLLNGYDLVKGSRFLPGGNTLDMPLYRRLGNRVLTTLANILFGTKYTDLVYGFHAFRKDAIEKMGLKSDSFEIDTELYLKAKKAGLKVIEVPSFENKRIHGDGKLRSFKDGWKILKKIITERIRN